MYMTIKNDIKTCGGLIPNDVIVFDTNDNVIIDNKTKEILLASLPRQTTSNQYSD